MELLVKVNFEGQFESKCERWHLAWNKAILDIKIGILIGINRSIKNVHVIINDIKIANNLA